MPDFPEKLQNIIHNSGNRQRQPTATMALLASLLIVTFLHLPLSVFPVGRDQGVWSTAGFAINKGAVFFKDYLHFNLPGLGFSYALVMNFTDDPRVASMLLSLAGSILIVVGMFLLLRHTVSSTTAAWAVLLFSIIWPTYIDFWNIAQKDFMAMYGVLFSTWLMARASLNDRWRQLSVFSAGISVGLAVMYKPVFGVTGILLAAVQTASFMLRPADADEKNSKPWRRLVGDISLLLAGGTAIAILLLIYLAKGDALAGLFNGLFVFAPAYSGIINKTALSKLTVLFDNPTILEEQIDWSILIHLLLWTPIVFSGLIMLARHAYAKREAWILVPFLTALFTFLIQGKAFGYHAIPWQICLFMAAGHVLDHIGNMISRIHQRRTVTVIITLAFILIIGRALFFSHYAKAELPTWLNRMSRQDYLKNNFPGIGPQIGMPSPLVSENLAQWLEQNSLPDDRILVWGVECQIYVLARRMFATQCPFDFLLTANLSGNERAVAWQKNIRQEFMQRLEKEKPIFIIIVSGDFSPVETVHSNEAAALVPGFQEIIDKQYHKVKNIQLFDVYQRSR